MLLLSFVIILQSCYKDHRKPNTSYVATIFCNHLCKVVTKIIAPKNPAHTSRRQLVPFFRQSPFRTFRQTCQPGFVVNTFVEMFEMEIVEKKGTSGRRLIQTAFRARMSIFKSGISGSGCYVSVFWDAMCLFSGML